MNRRQWLREFKRECPSSYEEAKRKSKKGAEVILNHNNELGYWICTIAVAEDPTF